MPAGARPWNRLLGLDTQGLGVAVFQGLGVSGLRLKG